MSASHKQDSSVPIPRLEDYDVSPITGFLPTTEPLRRLPNPYYKPWEDVVENLNALLLAGQLRNIVSELPMLDHTQLETQSELRRAFLILSMMSHAYIWGKSEAVSETLPACLAVPWHNISKRIGLRPVVCHAAVCLWNWRLIDAKKGRDLSNLACQHTYSGSTDEAWFYLVTTAIEAEGSRALPLIISALEAARAGDITAAADALEQMETVLKDINGVLNRMYDHCDPYVFYWRVRPYLAGWENMADGGLPNGVVYEGVEDDDSKGTPAFRKYAGGSAAQSSLIHALDIALGVEHRPTGMKRNGPVGERASSEKGQGHASGAPSATGKPDGAHNNFILKMREYMPEPHRNFLEHLNRAATLRPFVQNVAHPLCNDRSATENDRREAKRLVEMYDACLHQIKLFRDKHVQIVTLYIVIQARRGPSVGSAHVVPPGAPAAGTHASFHHEKTVSTVTDEIIHPSKQTGGIADKFSLESLSELTSKLGGTFLSKVTTTIAETTTITADTATVGLPSVMPSPPKSNSTLVDELSPTRSQLPSVVPSPPNSNSTLVGELSPTRFQFSPTKAPESTATVGLPSITPSPPNSNATLVDELSPSSTTSHGSSFGTSHPDFPQIVKVTDNTTVTVSSDESGAIKLHTIGLAKQSEEGSVVIRGTGGTNVLPFLKQARDEVTEAKLGIS